MVHIKHGNVLGEFIAPSSKSMTQRAYAVAYLASLQGCTCNILNPSECDDAIAVLNITKMLHSSDQEVVKLECGGSALALRMFSVIASLSNKDIILNAGNTLLDRPVGNIEAPLKQLGVHCKTHDGFPPVVIHGSLHSGNIEVDCSITSQFLTGLLMALPCVEGDSFIKVRNLKSKPYIEMTLQLLRTFGVSVERNKELTEFHVKGSQKYLPNDYLVEGDWSTASFFLVAGATTGNCKVSNINYDGSCQADKRILDVLQMCGANMIKNKDDVQVFKSNLKSFEFNITDSPDLFPPLVALALACKGKSTISGLERLTHKESDRAVVLFEELHKLGANVKIAEDEFSVVGGQIRGGTVDPRNDHRIAMATAIAGLSSEQGVRIKDEHCVSKSFPNFFIELKRLMTNE